MPSELQQLTMFGVPANPEFVFNVYHDESGTYFPGAGDRWLLHGVLFVPAEKQNWVVAALQQIRQDVGYFEEVHYVKLRGHITGPKARCAASWLSLYCGQFSEFCFYRCLAVDTHSSSFEHDRFGEPHHAYNRFARMAIEGAIAWSLKRYRHVALKFHSDAKFYREGNNFAVIAQALIGRSGQKAKIALAEMVAQWIEDTRRPPWLQTKELHRRFSVSCFPDEQGRFYNPSLAVMNRNQPALFEQ